MRRMRTRIQTAISSESTTYAHISTLSGVGSTTISTCSGEKRRIHLPENLAIVSVQKVGSAIAKGPSSYVQLSSRIMR